LIFSCPLNPIPCSSAFAAEIPAPESSDDQEMRAQYDDISAMKMKRYDELTQEIPILQEKIEELVSHILGTLRVATEKP
jgi:hypothetical protein